MGSRELKYLISTNMSLLTKLPSKILLILFLISLGGILALCQYAKSLKVEKEAYQTSMSVMMDSLYKYKVNDSLNAVQVGELKLTIGEYRRYRAEDANLIKKLKADKPTSITKLISHTRDTIRASLHDTIMLAANEPPDTARYFNYKSHWTDVDGLIYNDSIQVSIHNREELLIAESILRKKFLFIKLPPKIFGYKSRKLDVLSKNPNTTIADIEWVNFR